MSLYSIFSLILLNCFLLYNVSARIHNLKLENDSRHRMTLSTFGFLEGGTLAVNVSLFTFKATRSEPINNKIFGFTLDKSNSPGFSNYVESIGGCIWNKPEDTLVSVFFEFDLENKRINIERKGKDLERLRIVAEPRKQYLFDKGLEHGVNLAALPGDTKTTTAKSTNVEDKGKYSKTAPTKKPETGVPVRNVREAPATGSRSETDPPPIPKAAGTKAPKSSSTPVPSTKKVTEAAVPDLPLEISDGSVDFINSVPITLSSKDTMTVYSSYFLVHIQRSEEEGLYNLFFHNCLPINSLINLTLQIIEDNNGNYLSADEMPIPMLYFVFCVVFFVVTCAWFSVLRRAEEGVYKLHYLMLVVVFVKSVSCLFHGINMYMIQKNGIHVDAWAILWYIVYLTRGALMFVTVLLIGAGWAFIKHVFSDKEKKLFLVVMPLQILANVAWVIVEESEEGTSSYTLWNRIFMVVDLLCCFAILFPVIWSIRHLQEASRTDGKAAINLNKLKLFRFFYIQVVCYIYFTRIIVYLLKITLPFHYGWMRNLFAEVFLLCFFTLTGYKFRPTSDNPYLQVPIDSDDEDIEMEEVLTKTGNTDTVVRVNQGRGEDDSGRGSTATTVKQRESSHEFD